MVDLKIDRSPLLKVQQLHDALWRCHRILVDLRLQTGRYPLRGRGAAPAEAPWIHAVSGGRRRELVYSATPGVPMSYWLGPPGK